MTNMDDIQPRGDEAEDGALDRMRDAPVGTNDPNIVGDVGPTDVPPGMDPPDDGPASLDPLPQEGEPLTDVEGPTAYGRTTDPAT